MTDDQDAISTTDSLFQGRLKILQKEKGYRFSVDAPILAHHISLKDARTAVDLGTGCGIVAIIVAYRNPLVRLYGIEIQKELAELASRNVQLNRMQDRITIIHADMKDAQSVLEPGVIDAVFSNPPYRKLQSGRINPDPERAVARHEIKACLCDVTSVAEKLLRPSGRLIVIYPAERTTDLVVRMRACKLEPKRLRLVHARRDSDAELILAEAVKYAKPGLNVSPPLIVYKTDGSYTDEFKEIIGQ
jgi:tRNA1Val (adenine37-N6)-methyltransferase